MPHQLPNVRLKGFHRGLKIRRALGLRISLGVLFGGDTAGDDRLLPQSLHSGGHAAEFI